jgi:hypothetical protein
VKALPGPAPGRPASSSRVTGNLGGGGFVASDSLGLAFPLVFALAAILVGLAAGVNLLWIAAAILGPAVIVGFLIWMTTRRYTQTPARPWVDPDAETERRRPTQPRPVQGRTTVQVVEVMSIPKELTAVPSHFVAPVLDVEDTREVVPR